MENEKINRLIFLATELLDAHEWREAKFDGEDSPTKSMKLTEARGDVQRCLWKLEKVMGGEG